MSVIGSGKPETGLLIHIQTLLKSLNGELKGKKFLSEVRLNMLKYLGKSLNFICKLSNMTECVILYLAPDLDNFEKCEKCSWHIKTHF